jgi:hypothetical protein
MAKKKVTQSERFGLDVVVEIVMEKKSTLSKLSKEVRMIEISIA